MELFEYLMIYSTQSSKDSENLEKSGLSDGTTFIIPPEITLLGGIWLLIGHRFESFIYKCTTVSKLGMGTDKR